MLKLMYITNKPSIAKIVDKSGVDRVWIDLEVNGKEERQKDLDTVKSKHKISDIGKVRKVLKNAKLIVRINPFYEGTQDEIDAVIEQGAEIIMLPYFKTATEVKNFIQIINKRVNTCLLFETPEAIKNIDEILSIEGINEAHIGLNDLHLGYKKKFMFELLADGTVEKICEKFKEHEITYGFGGISKVGDGNLPAEHIIIEHYRLKSQIAILSRSFCNTNLIKCEEKIKEVFEKEVQKIRNIEKEAKFYTKEQLEENRKKVVEEVFEIVSK